jgi:beta-mannosidase
VGHLALFVDHSPDYQLAESVNLELDYSDEKSDYLKTNFPARHIYERLLPAVVEEFSPDIFYHRGSPYSQVLFLFSGVYSFQL